MRTLGDHLVESALVVAALLVHAVLFRAGRAPAGSASGEVPEHRAFIYETAIPRLEQLGVPVRVLRSDKTYLDLFAGSVTSRSEKRTSTRIPSVRALLRSAGLQTPSHPPV